MKSLFKSGTWSIGLAMFSMFFGAGNIIFPLAVGQFAGDKNLFAILGLIITAAIMPMAGVISMVLFEGNYRQFFGRLGRWPGLLLALTTISLLGPLGSTPRCIALAYTTLKSTFYDISPIYFSAFACIIIFFCSVSKKHVLTLLGAILTPLLLGSLVIIIALGLFHTPNLHTVESTDLSMFLHGISEGYNTMDLLAAFFISSTIINILRQSFDDKPNLKENYVSITLKASIIASMLLTAIYIGFSYIAAFQGTALNMHAKDELLAAITMRIAGPYAGTLVCIAIALACLTTAIALISAFTDFMQKEILHGKISYQATLAGALGITFMISILEFTAISAFLWPILQICYPGLIVLTFLNIAHRLTGFEMIKIPVFMTFTGSAVLYLV